MEIGRGMFQSKTFNRECYNLLIIYGLRTDWEFLRQLYRLTWGSLKLYAIGNDYRKTEKTLREELVQIIWSTETVMCNLFTDFLLDNNKQYEPYLLSIHELEREMSY